MKNRSAFLCSVSLGAAISSSAILVYSHVVAKPWWLSSEHAAAGWTIYPPLSALPQAIPGPGPEEWLSLMLYPGLFQAASVAAVVSMVFLFGALIVRKRLLLQDRPSAKYFFWPIFFLLPVAIHTVGKDYRNFQAAQRTDGGNYEAQAGNEYRVYGHGNLTDSMADSVSALRMQASDDSTEVVDDASDVSK